MKLLLILFVLALSVSALGDSDAKIKHFNKKLMENINKVISDNPQMYETKNIHVKKTSRGPASVPVNVDQERVKKISDLTQPEDKF